MASKKIDEPLRGNHQNSGETSFSDEILKLAQCLMPVAPTAKVKQVSAVKSAEAPLGEIAWKAYDSVVGLTKVATNGLYTNATVGQVLGTSIDMMLRWQRFNSAVAGAWFNALWPAGAPISAGCARSCAQW